MKKTNSIKELRQKIKTTVKIFGQKCDNRKIESSVFFDKIDKLIKKDSSYSEYLRNKITLENNSEVNIILSGDFGEKFKSLFEKEMKNYKFILVKGSIRLGTAKINLEKYKEDFKKRKSIFVDDSFCSGDTFKTIEKEIQKLDGDIKKIYVIYLNPKRKNYKSIPKKLETLFDFFKDYPEYYK